MCGRFNLIDEYDHVAKLFATRNQLQFPKRYNIAPSQAVIIIKNQIDAPADVINTPIMQLVQWGFIASWLKIPPKGLMINARSETALIKPMFRGAMEQNRCIIPASGWYEWKTIKGVKQPYYFSKDSRKTNNQLMGFAGIYSSFMAADGSEIETMAILTQDAAGKLCDIHHRMPCILHEDSYSDWLNGWDVRGRKALNLMDEEIVERLTYHAVSREMGKVGFDHAKIIDEITLEEKLRPKVKTGDQLNLF